MLKVLGNSKNASGKVLEALENSRNVSEKVLEVLENSKNASGNVRKAFENKRSMSWNGLIKAFFERCICVRGEADILFMHPRLLIEKGVMPGA